MANNAYTVPGRISIALDVPCSVPITEALIDEMISLAAARTRYEMGQLQIAREHAAAEARVINRRGCRRVSW
jgi:hypothetical protein